MIGGSRRKKGAFEISSLNTNAATITAISTTMSVQAGALT